MTDPWGWPAELTAASSCLAFQVQGRSSPIRRPMISRFGSCPTGDGRCDLSRTGKDRRTGRPGPGADAGHANPPSMLWPIMEHVTPLTERPDVAVPASTVGRVVIEMCSRQHGLRRPERRIRGRRGDLAASAVPPGLFRLIPPATITQMLHGLAMRPATDLAAALGAHEPDPVADLRPVDRVQVAQLGPDRHSGSQVAGLPGVLRPAARWAGGRATEDGDPLGARPRRDARGWSGGSSAASGSGASALLPLLTRSTRPPSRGSTSIMSPLFAPSARSISCPFYGGTPTPVVRDKALPGAG